MAQTTLGRHLPNALSGLLTGWHLFPNPTWALSSLAGWKSCTFRQSSFLDWFSCPSPVTTDFPVCDADESRRLNHVSNKHGMINAY